MRVRRAGAGAKGRTGAGTCGGGRAGGWAGTHRLLVIGLRLLGNRVLDDRLPLVALLGGVGADDVGALAGDQLERVRADAAALLLDDLETRALVQVDRAERCNSIIKRTDRTRQSRVKPGKQGEGRGP